MYENSTILEITDKYIAIRIESKGLHVRLKVESEVGSEEKSSWL